MHFLVILALFMALAVWAPRAARLLEFLIFAPIIGCAFGGFAWAIAAMFFASLITWAAFGTFLACGTIISMIIVARL